MDEPKVKVCKKCEAKIYGLSDKDLKYKMILHSIKHTKEEENHKEDKHDRKRKSTS